MVKTILKSAPPAIRRALFLVKLQITQLNQNTACFGGIFNCSK